MGKDEMNVDENRNDERNHTNSCKERYKPSLACPTRSIASGKLPPFSFKEKALYAPPRAS
jgi:hypothetical protein